VPWKTHEAIASVEDADERREMLDRAGSEGWTVREAKAEVSRLKAARAIGAPATGDGTCTVADLWRLVESGRKFGSIYADPNERAEEKIAC
jgi:hypothetical protein